MIAPLVRSAMVMGLIVVIGCGWSLLFVHPGTGEFVISVFGIALGGLVVVACAVLVRRDIRRTPFKEEK